MKTYIPTSLFLSPAPTEKENAGPVCLKAEFHCEDETVIPEFLFPESPLSWLRGKFAKWWKELKGDEPVPATVAEAIERGGELFPRPVSIEADVEKEYQKISKYNF